MNGLLFFIELLKRESALGLGEKLEAQEHPCSDKEDPEEQKRPAAGHALLPGAPRDAFPGVRFRILRKGAY